MLSYLFLFPFQCSIFSLLHLRKNQVRDTYIKYLQPCFFQVHNILTDFFFQELGIKPGPFYGKLKTGKPVEFEGKVLQPEDFLGKERFDRKIKNSLDLDEKIKKKRNRKKEFDLFTFSFAKLQEHFLLYKNVILNYIL